MAGRDPYLTRINRALRDLGSSVSLEVSPSGGRVRLRASLPLPDGSCKQRRISTAGGWRPSPANAGCRPARCRTPQRRGSAVLKPCGAQKPGGRSSANGGPVRMWPGPPPMQARWNPCCYRGPGLSSPFVPLWLASPLGAAVVASRREIFPPPLGVAKGRLSPGKGWGTLVVCLWHRRRLSVWSRLLEALRW